MIQRGKLHAYHAATYDNDLARKFCGGQGIRRIPYMRVVLDARYRRYEIGTARTDHEVLGLVDLAVAGDRHQFIRTAFHIGKTRYERTMFVIKTLLDAGDKFANHDRLAFLHGCKIEGHVLCGYPVFLRVRSVIILFGAVEQGLSRDTTYIEARTAEGGLLKEHYIFACFGSFFSSRVARRAAANDG